MAHLLNCSKCEHKFYMLWNTKIFMWLTLLQYLLYFSALESNPSYLEICLYLVIWNWHCDLVTWSVQFSCSFVSVSLWPHGLQHSRPPCPSSSPEVYPNSCPLSRWCHPTISSFVIPFFSCLQSFPSSGSLQLSQLFTSGGQSIGNFSFKISPSSEHSVLISFRMG